jgi:hypothetical protein
MSKNPTDNVSRWCNIMHSALISELRAKIIHNGVSKTELFLLWNCNVIVESNIFRPLYPPLFSSVRHDVTGTRWHYDARPLDWADDAVEWRHASVTTAAGRSEHDDALTSQRHIERCVATRASDVRPYNYDFRSHSHTLTKEVVANNRK